MSIYQRSVTLTTMVLKGPVKAGENGSVVPVKEKQRPQASPGPRPGGAPKASWFIAAVNPLPVSPQAIFHNKLVYSLVSDTSGVSSPGDPQPEYIVKEQEPEGF